MKKRKVIMTLSSSILSLSLLAGCSNTTNSQTNGSATSASTTATVAPATPKVAPAFTGAGGEKDLTDGEKLATYTMDNGVKVFHLDAKPVQWEVTKGVYKTAWAYNGSVPGPQIRVNQGDRVRIIVKNDLPEGTTVHWHGLEVPNNMDGVPMVTQDPIQPGQTFTYEFTVNQTGTFMYHSHEDDLKQVGMGLYGAIVVLPKGETELPNVQSDFVFMVADGPLGYIINGKSFPDTVMPTVKVGKPVHVRMLNIGTMDHPFHLHGFNFTVLAKDGCPLPQPYQENTVDLMPGDTYDLQFTPDRVGTWVFHCHVLPHVDDGKGNMTGMITGFKVVL
jgi:FtsP/CotA-like multicopper oxidase with cupredoxin domain